ncbi:hypothetical protein TNCV_1056021 [Trichonephila clavipes]|nr:hypothetical protein TNCV_1056021 [Trichonephila clavipes]
MIDDAEEDEFASNPDYVKKDGETYFKRSSELIAIDEVLRIIIKTMTSPDEIWILCDSRSAIQHLSDWTKMLRQKHRSQFKNLKELSQQHEIYSNGFHLTGLSLFGNDTADL